MRLLLLFICAITMSVIASGQHYTDGGNTWIFSKVNWELQTGEHIQIKMDGDTLIQNHVYKTLLQADDAFNPNWYRVNYFLREDDQKIVYILDATGQEGILYHFGLEVGQQVVLWNGFTVTVKSIDSVQVANNQMQRRLNINATYGSQGSECTSSTHWIDEVENPIPSGYCLDHITYSLPCFIRYDEVYFPINNSWCDEFTSATVPVTEIGLSIFPNPVTNILTIQFNDVLYQSRKIQLYNSQGQLVYHDFSDDPIQQIDMSRMASGVFLLNVVSGNENLICRKIVKL